MQEHYSILPFPFKKEIWKDFRQILNLLKVTECLSENETGTFVNERFLCAVRRFVFYVPYYKKKWGKL